MISILYALSIVLLLAVFLLYPKSDNGQHFLTWLAIALFGYELFSSAVGGLLTILHIPADIFTIALCNLICSACMIICYRKRNGKTAQSYHVQVWELLLVAAAGVIVLWFGWDRFEMLAVPNYETSDPGVHLRLAMTCVNEKIANGGSGMVVSQFTNALWIQMLEPVFDGVFRYRTFILKDMYNLFLSALVFFAAFTSKGRKKYFDGKAIAVTAAYVVGYPLNNLLFGFQYLGLGVTVLCFLYIVASLYLEGEIKRNWLIFFMNVGCIGSVLSYTLFAPVVYFALFGLLTWDFLRTDHTADLQKKMMSYIKLHLSVFLIPVLYAVYFVVLGWDAQSGGISISGALSAEGYIYRNLYSDFILVLPFAIYGWIISIKEKKWTLFTVFLPLQILYCAYFFHGMLNGTVSTYYFYKLNYINALLLFGLGLEGIQVLVRQKSGGFVNGYIAMSACLYLIWSTGAVANIQTKNINNAPFLDEEVFFRINYMNDVLIERKYFNEDLIILSEALYELKQDDERVCLILGDWLTNYWYEAITNQSLNTSYAYLIGSQGVLDRFVNDRSFGDYMVVMTNSDEEVAVQDQLQTFNVIFSTDTGYIISR